MTLAYADDIACICPSWEDLTNAIATIKRWCSVNRIALNAPKSGWFEVVQRITKKNRPLRNLGGIPEVRSYKYLGIHLRPDMRLKEHVEALRHRCEKSKGLFAKLAASRISVQTRIEIWQVFVKSFLLYGLETGPLDKVAWQLIERCYTNTLKCAARCPRNASNNRLLYVTEQWTPTVLMAYRMLSVRRKYLEHFGEDLPQSIRSWLDDVCNEHTLDQRELFDLGKSVIRKLLWKADRTKLIRGLGEEDVTRFGEFTQHKLLRIGDQRDNFILRYYLNISGLLTNFNSGRYTIDNCPTCNVKGTQKHFINECPIFEEPRRELLYIIELFIEDLNMNININININDISSDLHKFIFSYLYDERFGPHRHSIHTCIKVYLYKVCLDVYGLINRP
jgi:hypothetical protein